MIMNGVAIVALYHPVRTTRSYRCRESTRVRLLRLLGATHGIMVGHVTPEAADGGPIAVVRSVALGSLGMSTSAAAVHCLIAYVQPRRTQPPGGPVDVFVCWLDILTVCVSMSVTLIGPQTSPPRSYWMSLSHTLSTCVVMAIPSALTSARKPSTWTFPRKNCECTVFG